MATLPTTLLSSGSDVAHVTDSENDMYDDAWDDMDMEEVETLVSRAQSAQVRIAPLAQVFRIREY